MGIADMGVKAQTTAWDCDPPASSTCSSARIEHMFKGLEHVGVGAMIGFGTHTGTVAAASDWGGDVEIKRVRTSHRDSYERACHDASVPRFLLDFSRDQALRRRLRVFGAMLR